jgi:hypothetical protein
MIKRFYRCLFPTETLRIHSVDLAGTLGYQKRISRSRVEVESHAEKAVHCYFTADASRLEKRYVGRGNYVTEKES